MMFFQLQLLFGPIIFTSGSSKLSKLLWVGIQNTQLNFLLIPEVLSIFHSHWSVCSFVLWAINFKWVKYQSQDRHRG